MAYTHLLQLSKISANLGRTEIIENPDYVEETGKTLDNQLKSTNILRCTLVIWKLQKCTGRIRGKGNEPAEPLLM